MTRLNGKTLIATVAVCSMSVGALYAQSKRTATKPAASESDATSTEWPTYGHDAGGMRHSPLTEITPANVNNLEIAWTYHLKPEGYAASGAGGGRGGGRGAATGEEPTAAAVGGRAGAPGGGRGGAAGLRGSQATPLIINGIMYIASPYGRVVALDPTTGKEVWVYTLPSGNPATRGVEYFSGDATTPPQIVVGTMDAKLFTLDAKTGALNTARSARTASSTSTRRT